MQLVVTRKGSILTPAGILLKPGTKVGRGLFTDVQVKEHLHSQYLAEIPEDAPPIVDVPEEVQAPVRKDNIGENVSESQINMADLEAAQKRDSKVMVAGVTSSAPDAVGQGKVEVEGDKPEGNKPEGKKLISEGKWNANPVDLAEKSLEDLNLMVLAKDETVVPFETVEEARAHLSQDYREPEKSEE